MTQRYRLPCPSCARSFEVATPQAGETLVCDCGAQILVPKLRELRQLEPAETAEERPLPSENWNPIRGSLFVLGMLLMAAGIYASFRIQQERKQLNLTRPAFRELTYDVQELTPLEAWEWWDYFRKDDLRFRTTPQYLEERAKHKTLGRYLIGTGSIAGLGLILVGVSLISPWVSSYLGPQSGPS
jgi:hypothetical protein